MSVLISILLVVEVVVAFLLIVVILAQKSKDQGLGMAFGGGMGESLFGSRAGNVLTRMTVGLSVVFMITTILLGILFAQGRTGSGSVMDRADREAPVAPMAPAPAPAPAPMAAEAGSVPMAAPVAAPTAPMVLEMGEGGELVPAEAVEEPVAAPAEAEAAVEASAGDAAGEAETESAE